jgi:hypothetical protein
MTPSVRLPLVKLSSQSRVELDRVVARLGDGYSEYMIGIVQGHGDVRLRAVAG